MRCEHKQILVKYLPKETVEFIAKKIEQEQVSFKITPPRRTKLGDYSNDIVSGQHRITVNSGLHPVRFLIVTLHEFAHLYVYKKYGRKVAPHGREWREMFAQQLQEAIALKYIPQELATLIEVHKHELPRDFFQRKDVVVAMEFIEHRNEDASPLFLLKEGEVFLFENQQWCVKEKLRTRYKCKNLSDGKTYIVPGSVWVKKTS